MIYFQIIRYEYIVLHIADFLWCHIQEVKLNY